jgi:hypothetical protein
VCRPIQGVSTDANNIEGQIFVRLRNSRFIKWPLNFFYLKRTSQGTPVPRASRNILEKRRKSLAYVGIRTPDNP